MKWNKPAVWGGVGAALAAIVPLVLSDSGQDAMVKPLQVIVGIAGCVVAFCGPLLGYLSGRKKNDGSGT